MPTQALHRGHVWTYDFVFDRTQRREVLKMLVVLDEYTRECHAIKVGRRLGSEAVIVTLDGLFGRYGAPAYLCSDNGGEFIAARLELGRRQYNEQRLHSALCYQTPSVVALGAWLMSQAMVKPDRREGA